MRLTRCIAAVLAVLVASATAEIQPAPKPINTVVPIHENGNFRLCFDALKETQMAVFRLELSVKKIRRIGPGGVGDLTDVHWGAVVLENLVREMTSLVQNSPPFNEVDSSQLAKETVPIAKSVTHIAELLLEKRKYIRYFMLMFDYSKSVASDMRRQKLAMQDFGNAFRIKLSAPWGDLGQLVDHDLTVKIDKVIKEFSKCKGIFCMHKAGSV